MTHLKKAKSCYLEGANLGQSNVTGQAGTGTVPVLSIKIKILIEELIK